MGKLLNVMVDFSVYEGSQITNDPADTTKLLSRLEGLAVSQASRTQMSVPTGGGYSTVPILAAGGSYLLVSIDQSVTVKLNAGAQVLTLTPSAAGTKTFVLFFKGTITQLDVAVPGVTAANVDVIVAKI